MGSMVETTKGLSNEHFPPWTDWVHPWLTVLVEGMCSPTVPWRVPRPRSLANQCGRGMVLMGELGAGSCGHHCLHCPLQCQSCCLKDTELHNSLLLQGF